MTTPKATTTPESVARGDIDAGPPGAPLVILAAGGQAPIDVAAAATQSGRKVFVVGLDGTADPGIAAFPHAFAKWGQIGRIESLIRAHGATELVLVGTVSRRPDFSSIAVDFGALRHLPRIMKAMFGGDDAVLAKLSRYAEENGFRIVGAHEVAPDLVAAAGAVAGPAPSHDMLADAEQALAAARAIGAIDAGQGAVVVAGRVVALEGAEGTDAMLDRVAALRAEARVRWSGRAGVLAKCPKPQQDLRLDMPAIGPHTVEKVVEAGLAGIAIEAGRVMIASRAETVALADRTATFIHALPPRDGQ